MQNFEYKKHCNKNSYNIVCTMFLMSDEGLEGG